MTNITYLVKDREEEIFSVDLPEKLYCRLTLEYKLDFVSDDESSYAEDPADMYHYTEIVCADVPLFAFIAGYRYSAIEHTAELNAKYDEIITTNEVVVNITPELVISYDTFYVPPPETAVASDYVPPTVVVEVRPENAPVIPAVEPVPDPRDLPPAA